MPEKKTTANTKSKTPEQIAAEEKAAAEEKTRAEAKKDQVVMVAVQPILHDGETVAPGKAFTVTPKQAVKHLAHGTAKEK